MPLSDLFWRPLAWLLSREPIAQRLVWRAMRTPYTPIVSRDGQDVYMFRWWLFNPYPGSGQPRRYGEWLPSIRVHHIRHPDQDDHLHDHPWNARTIILSGGYLEQLQTGELVERERGCTARIRHGQFHRIAAVGPHGATTLFITWRYRGSWGFLVDGVKIGWRQYLSARGRL